ncbi:hypothetical protein B0H12DRAFT_1244284 [Mycena haematopus]|nr:hypothetical protein B0H12DRAFT_1244284 [Mycena haematopus]
MHWDLVVWTREQIELTQTGDSKTVKAILIPDGGLMSHWVWVRVPVHAGLRRALTVDHINTDIWMDASRGAGSATSDLAGRSFQIDRYPLDEPRDLTHSYTIVVAPQHTEGHHVYPENALINKLVPELDKPWRGNVLIFRHSKTAAGFVINMEERDRTAVEWMLSTVFRKGIVNSRGTTHQVLP